MKFTEQQIRGFEKSLEKDRAALKRAQENVDNIQSRIDGLEALVAEARK